MCTSPLCGRGRRALARRVRGNRVYAPVTNQEDDTNQAGLIRCDIYRFHLVV